MTHLICIDFKLKPKYRELTCVSSNMLKTAPSEEDPQHAMDAFNYLYTVLDSSSMRRRLKSYINRHLISRNPTAIDSRRTDTRKRGRLYCLGSTLSVNANIDAEIDRRLQATGIAIGSSNVAFLMTKTKTATRK